MVVKPTHLMSIYPVGADGIRETTPGVAPLLANAIRSYPRP
jgi:hypothetical protein